MTALANADCFGIEGPHGDGLVSDIVDDKIIPMPVAELKDTALMDRVKLGDREAFEELVSRYRLPVMNLINRTLRDLTEAEDLAQGVFVQVYKAAHRYQPTARFSTWIFTIARNLCLNEIRRRTRHPAESMEAQLQTGDGEIVQQFEDRRVNGPGHDALREELVSKIDESIRDLPENQRTALILCREGDLSYEDIAEVIGKSVSAVKSLIFRGRETLKKRLKPYLKTGEWEPARQSADSAS